MLTPDVSSKQADEKGIFFHPYKIQSELSYDSDAFTTVANTKGRHQKTVRQCQNRPNVRQNKTPKKCIDPAQTLNYTSQESATTSSPKPSRDNRNKAEPRTQQSMNIPRTPKTTARWQNNSTRRLPAEVHRNWMIQMGKTTIGKTHQGDTFHLRSKKGSKDQAIIKIYQYNKKSEETNLQRVFQEKTALDLIKDVNNVPKVEESNIPSTMNDMLQIKKPLYIILNYIHGLKLMKYIDTLSTDNSSIQLIDIIQFCQKLLITIKEIHARGIIHRDIKPANIIMKYDGRVTSLILNQCTPILVDFGQAYIQTDTNGMSVKEYHLSIDRERSMSKLHEDMGHKWCRVPQLVKITDACINQMTELEKYEKMHLRRSPTIDTSSLCAILFALITKQHPRISRDESGLQPHQRSFDILQSVIKNTVQNAKLQTRLEVYLMDTSDKGFGLFDTQWTVRQLTIRLDFILRLLRDAQKEDILENEGSNTNIEKSIEVLSDGTVKPELKSNELLICRFDFMQAANTFSQAKHIYINKPLPSGFFQWSSSICQWTDEINSLHEKKHFDTLTYSNPDFKWSMLIIFHCYIDISGAVIKLSIGTIIDGVTIMLPIARFKQEIEVINIPNRFITELNTLIELSRKEHILSELNNLQLTNKQ